MSKFEINFNGVPLAMLSSYLTGAEIAYFRGLGFQTVEQLYGALVSIPTDLDEINSKALRACEQNLTEEQMESLAPTSEDYSTGLLDG
jgi:hypothetical protein